MTKYETADNDYVQSCIDTNQRFVAGRWPSADAVAQAGGPVVDREAQR